MRVQYVVAVLDVITAAASPVKYDVVCLFVDDLEAANLAVFVVVDLRNVERIKAFILAVVARDLAVLRGNPDKRCRVQLPANRLLCWFISQQT